MIIAIAALLALVAFVILCRLLWLSARPARHSTLIALAAAALVAGLAVLALTGRLHWLVAVGAAVFPFLRRAGPLLLRYLPLLRRFQQRANGSGTGQERQGRGSSSADTMTRQRALEILALDGNPTREDIVAAHRRLVQRLHPDRGGSTYLTAQLNDAKARLLDDL